MKDYTMEEWYRINFERNDYDQLNLKPERIKVISDDDIYVVIKDGTIMHAFREYYGEGNSGLYVVPEKNPSMELLSIIFCEECPFFYEDEHSGGCYCDDRKAQSSKRNCMHYYDEPSFKKGKEGSKND